VYPQRYFASRILVREPVAGLFHRRLRRRSRLYSAPRFLAQVPILGAGQAREGFARSVENDVERTALWINRLSSVLEAFAGSSCLFPRSPFHLLATTGKTKLFTSFCQTGLVMDRRISDVYSIVMTKGQPEALLPIGKNGRIPESHVGRADDSPASGPSCPILGT
jgi:hypothetical protein